MSELLDSITQQLSGGAMTQIAQQIGADPATTSTAVQTALPMLLGGLAHNATQPGGAQALDNALGQHDPNLLDQLGGMLGGGTGGGAQALGGLGGLGGMLGGAGAGGGLGGILGSVLGGGAGGSILGHVLGGNQSNVTNSVGQASGMQPAQVGKLLMILAPIVMAALAKRKQQQGLDASTIGPDLQQQRQQAEARSPNLGGILGSIFGGGR
jgi:hypothetical protein